ncbi:spore coat protein U domain-containing protein [Ramlibacter sp. PS3R-8]|uniref:spore coat protein U domain-containing protein n=1 Tax=Ramlibacter sp. PS3R-8 TaxID=3133437 RepID=UPI00309AFE51
MNTSIRAIAAAAVALAASTTFAASDTATLNVTASVAAVCKLTLSGPMAFGALDPTSTADATATVTASYKCTKGTPVTSFTVNGVTTGTYAGTMTGAGTTPDSIAYAIAWTNPTAYTGLGLGAVTAKTVSLGGTILNANFVNVKPDTYSGSVGVAVNY